MSSPSKRSSSEDSSFSSAKRAATARLMGRDEEDDSRVGGAASRSTRDYIDCLDSILHPNSDANASEELLGTLQELQQMDANLQSMKEKLREMRVSAAQELLEQALLYQPTLREALADAQAELAATAATISASVSAAFSELEATDLALASLGETSPDPPAYSGGDQAGDAASSLSTTSDHETNTTGTAANTAVANVGSEQSVELVNTNCRGSQIFSESTSIAGDNSTIESDTISAILDHPVKPVVSFCVCPDRATDKEMVSAATTSYGAESSTTDIENFNVTRQVVCAAGAVSQFPSDLKASVCDNLNASQPSCLDSRMSFSSDGVSVQLSSSDTISCAPVTSSSKEQDTRVKPLKVCSSASLVNETVSVHEYVGSVACDVLSAGVAVPASPMHEEQSVSSQNRSELMNDNVGKQSQIYIFPTQEICEPIEAMEVDDDVTLQSRPEAALFDCQTHNDSHDNNNEDRDIKHRSDFRDSQNSKQEGPDQFSTLSYEIPNNSEAEIFTFSETGMQSNLNNEVTSSNALVDALDMEVAPEFLSPVLVECNSGLTKLPVQRILHDETPNEQPVGLLSENNSIEVENNEKTCSSAEQSTGTLQENEHFQPDVIPPANETFQQNAHTMLEKNETPRKANVVTEHGVEYSFTLSTVDQQTTTEYNNPRLKHLQQQANMETEQLDEQRACNEMTSNQQTVILVPVHDNGDTLTEEADSPVKPFLYMRDPKRVDMEDSLASDVLAAVTNEEQVVPTVCQFPHVEGTRGPSEVDESAAGNYFAGVAETTAMNLQISVSVNEGIEYHVENDFQHNTSVKTSVQDQLENVGEPQMSVQQELESHVQMKSDHFQQQEVVLVNQETCVQPRPTLLDSQVDPVPEETVSAHQKPANGASSMVVDCSQTNSTIIKESEASSITQSDGRLPSNQPLSHSGGRSMQCSSLSSNLSSDVALELRSMEVPQEATSETILTSSVPAPTVQGKHSVTQSLDSRETLTSDRQQDSVSPVVTQQLLALLRTFANSSSVTSSAGDESLIPNIINPELTQALIVQMQGALASHQSLVAAPATTNTSQKVERPLQHLASENVEDTENE